MQLQPNKIYFNDYDSRVSIVVSNRQNRPITKADDPCPFCPGGLEFVDSNGCYFFKNRFPAMGNESCEVVVFSPDHNRNIFELPPEDVEKIIRLWIERTQYFIDTQKMKYVLIFENNGAEVGATISHPHGQIYAFNFVPQVPKTELSNAGCYFCNKADPRLIIAETQMFETYVVQAASYPFELIIKTKEHLSSLVDLSNVQIKDLVVSLLLSLKAIAFQFMAPMPYMMWVHQGPFNNEQELSGHLHIHICGLYRSEKTMRFIAAGELGSGVMFNPIDPYDAADMLRTKIPK